MSQTYLEKNIKNPTIKKMAEKIYDKIKNYKGELIDSRFYVVSIPQKELENSILQDESFNFEEINPALEELKRINLIDDIEYENDVKTVKVTVPIYY